MKVNITIPNLTVPHGGIRILIEWANRLAKFHDVKVIAPQNDCHWMLINVPILSDYEDCDVLIIGSPHHIHLDGKAPKTFIFCQMAEHLFKPNDIRWQKLCKQFYLSKSPMLSISAWNINDFLKMGRNSETYYIENGINTDHFPIEKHKKDFKTVLIEGWQSNNPTKDSSNIAQKVAAELKRQGYKIIAYSQNETTSQIPNEYYVRPSIDKMNELYRRATILIKASHYDARSCAPIEAMTKGTVTVRAIGQGDDDLIHDYNCIRTAYNYEDLLANSLNLLQNPQKFYKLQQNGYEYLKTINWDLVIRKINRIICG